MFDFRSHNPFAARRLAAGRPLGGNGHDHGEREGHVPSDPAQSPDPSQARGSETADAKEDLTGPRPVPKGRYRIVSDLGVGAFGNVCLAEDEATGHEVAIRFLPRGLTGVPTAAQTRQRRGGSLVAASAAHPALVRVLELGDAENGHAFVAMELVQGRRLSEVLSEGPLDVGAALRLALDLGGAVETLHN